MARTPLEEKKLYDGATSMVETSRTVLPISTIGMQARKKALREQRVTPEWQFKEAQTVVVEAEAEVEVEAEAVAPAEVEVEEAPKKGLVDRILGK